MNPYRKAQIIPVLFDLSVIGKGLDGVLEMVGGVLPFLGYQLYRPTLPHSPALSMLDLLVITLTWIEYVRLRTLAEDQPSLRLHPAQRRLRWFRIGRIIDHDIQDDRAVDGRDHPRHRWMVLVDSAPVRETTRSSPLVKHVLGVSLRRDKRSIPHL
jgi:hypothetical protein